MKHFTITLIADTHEFKHECSTITEAYDAIRDASTVFGIGVNTDELMETLVEMNQEKASTIQNNQIRIRVYDDVNQKGEG